MRYFDREERALRYERYRPRVHDRVVSDLADVRSFGRVDRALDIGCGTGQSTSALAAVADCAVGIDISRAMLRSAPAELNGRVAAASGEVLPIRADCMGLVVASMAFHWMDQPTVLDEIARVLQPGGEVWIYNLWFVGELEGNADFAPWVRERYLARYPSPARKSQPLDQLLSPEGRLLGLGNHRWSYSIPFSALSLRNYLTTQSNVEVALEGGATLREIDAWLDAELAPFFETEETASFVYGGYADFAGLA